MSSKWSEFGVEKHDSWQEISILAIELCSSNDPIVSMHADLWIDQCMYRYNMYVHTL